MTDPIEEIVQEMWIEAGCQSTQPPYTTAHPTTVPMALLASRLESFWTPELRAFVEAAEAFAETWPSPPLRREGVQPDPFFSMIYTYRALAESRK